MNYRHPELQRLLNNLNNASQNKQSNASDSAVTFSNISGSPNQNTVTPTLSSSQALANRNTEQQDGISNTANKMSFVNNAQHTVTSLKPQESRSRSLTPSTQIVPDASTITTWPAAIKHVAKHIIPDDKATTRIKHLIKQQQQHEEQWWSQREAIIAKHQGRAGSNSKVADILKELGGLAVPIAKVDAAADKNELEMFDKKVYRSLVQMAADFDAQLRKLGVPFYAVKHDLILTGTETETDKPLTMKGKLDKGELRELQKRMLHHLEDLLMDD